MDIDTRHRELTFSIHGIDRVGSASNSLVSADVFSKKVQAFLAALKAADKQINSKVTRNFVVSRLEIGSAVMGIKETPKLRKARPALSAVTALIDCSDLIYRGDFRKAEQRYNGVTAKLPAISREAGIKFSHIELLADGVPQIRLDTFFESQIAELRAPAPVGADAHAFKGQARDAFFGTLKEIDIRGQIWRGKFVLDAAQREIDCVFRRLSLQQVKEALDVRCWIEGLAIYQTASALPQRLEVDTIRIATRRGEGIERWRGTVAPFTLDAWEASDDGLR